MKVCSCYSEEINKVAQRPGGSQLESGGRGGRRQPHAHTGCIKQQVAQCSASSSSSLSASLAFSNSSQIPFNPSLCFTVSPVCLPVMPPLLSGEQRKQVREIPEANSAS